MEVEALAERGELQPIPLGSPRFGPDAPSHFPAHGLVWIRVGVLPDAAGYRVRLDGDPVRWSDSDSYLRPSSAGPVTAQVIWPNGAENPFPLCRCDATAAGSSGRDLLAGDWCGLVALPEGVRGLRVAMSGGIRVEFPRAEGPPELEAYARDRLDGELWVQVRSEAEPLSQVMVHVSYMSGGQNFGVPVRRGQDADCFFVLRSPGSGRLNDRAGGYLGTLSGEYSLGPASFSLPKARPSKGRWGPVSERDFDALLETHLDWLGIGQRRHNNRRKWFWRDVDALRKHIASCPPRPDAPTRADLDGVDLSEVRLHDRELQRATLRGAGFPGQRLDKTDLCGADLTGADMRGVRARTIVLVDAVLTDVDARAAQLWGKMDRSDWHGADLRGAALEGSLRSADFTDADLGGGRLRGDLGGANFHGVRLVGTDLRGANLQTARNLMQAQLDQACGDASTRLPAPLHVADCL